MKKELMAVLVASAMLSLQGCGDESKSDKVGTAAPSLTEAAVVSAVGAPVVKRIVKQGEACAISRYKFSRDTVGMTLEFSCGRTNISWHKAEGESASQAQAGQELARRALAGMSGADGAEVDAALKGEVFRLKSLGRGLKLSGSCKSNNCLITISGEVARDSEVAKSSS
ncbi:MULTISPECIES: hypothetical protein [unclassified Pseudomonas]|uniref:hypothetical protein n=1 Tax=unclassified Pseudomonas TaxID=196821 RepID=UPI000EA96035|nr:MULTISPECIES: hypothetical protein [unclassified Pseudomonas]AYF89607.1 hypothetical protein D6Z43_21545 [Pseudomonas sp. DY-1]MDH4656154.1 hypothetical protein [Pseudomonas sp. BN606]MRK21237.1 hypothetical protein [Pseudomonas sp. JG-B]